MSVVSISVNVYQAHTQARAIRDMIHTTDVVTCEREGVTTRMISTELVPGAFRCGEHAFV
jgi:phosphoribosylaminoimidazole carboxylase (NCAIR synthetase)